MRFARKRSIVGLNASALSARNANSRGSSPSDHWRVAQLPLFANHPHGLSFCLRAYHFFLTAPPSAHRYQRLLRHDLFQPRVLLFQQAQPTHFAYFHASVLGLSLVGRGITNPLPPTKILHRRSTLRFTQHRDDLLFAEPTPLHTPSPLTVLCPEKLTFAWTKFRGAGQPHRRTRNRCVEPACFEKAMSFGSWSLLGWNRTLLSKSSTDRL